MRFSKTAVLWLTLVAVSSGQSSTSPANPGDPPARLPVTRVILYKNGVGYFEHAGHVRGSQDVNVDFTTAQLNDVLKSLTVLDLGKGRITGVSYNSAAPLEQRLGSLRLPVGENPTTAQFLDALRGARVEIRSGSVAASGRLLSIEEREVLTGQRCAEQRGKRRIRQQDWPDPNLPRQRQRRSAHLRPDAFHQRSCHRKRCERRSGQISWARRFDARSGCPPHDHLHRRGRRARSAGQLHQRSAGVEEHLPHRDSERGQAAAAGMGHRRQHGRRRLEGCRIVAGRGRSAVVRAGALAAVLHAAAGGRAAGECDAHAADA